MKKCLCPPITILYTDYLEGHKDISVPNIITVRLDLGKLRRSEYLKIFCCWIAKARKINQICLHSDRHPFYILSKRPFMITDHYRTARFVEVTLVVRLFEDFCC